jgi:hypothetical protein
MGKYAEGLAMNKDLIYEVNALQYKAGIQMANLAKKADEFDEVQLAIYSLEFARELSGGIGKKNEDLLIQLKDKLKSLDDYKSRVLIDREMINARLELAKAKTEKLEVGLSVPDIQRLLGEPHEKILGNGGTNIEEQLWIYFTNKKSLQLSFVNFILFKIEEI